MSETQLIHYSAQPELKPESCSNKGHIHFKPRGLWVSVGTAWKDWCDSEEFEWAKLKHEHTINLKSDNNVLVMTTPEELIAFSQMYKSDLVTVESVLKETNLVAIDSIRHKVAKLLGDPFDQSEYVHYIDWGHVSNKHQGIIINPYQFGCRCDPKTQWYYPWDVASGCIWDVDCIEDVQIANEK